MDYFVNPIRQLQLLGDWSHNHGFKEIDRRLLQSPKGVSKIRDYFQRTQFIFDIYLVNSSQSNNWAFREKGVVLPEFLEEKMGLFLPLQPDAINIVYTNNYGADKIHFSAWIMAHRFGHALSASHRNLNPNSKYADLLTEAWPEFSNFIIENVLGRTSKIWKSVDNDHTRPWERISRDRLRVMRLLAMHLGTMRTARDRTLRTAYEFPYELLAQYLLTGKIRLNPLSPHLQKEKYAWGRPQYLYSQDITQIEEFNQWLPNLQKEIEMMIEKILQDAVGKTFLM